LRQAGFFLAKKFYSKAYEHPTIYARLSFGRRRTVWEFSSKNLTAADGVGFPTLTEFFHANVAWRIPGRRAEGKPGRLWHRQSLVRLKARAQIAT